jgi:hypothetical protein
MKALIAAVLLLVPALGEAQSYRAPRTAYGQPDLQGAWTNASLTRIERPDGFETVVVPPEKARAFEAGHSGLATVPDDETGQAQTEWYELGGKLSRVDGQARAAIVVDPADGRLPYTEAGRQAATARLGFDGPEARTPSERCLNGTGTPAGPPMFNAPYNNNYRILQTRDHVAILVEMNHDVRIVRLGGSRAPPSIQLWMGDSVGHWEGETLVVETGNLQPQEASRGSSSIGRTYISGDAKIVERFTRVAPDRIRYAFTVDDPATFSRPWRGESTFTSSKAAMFEFACHEGNYSMRGILGGARAAEAAARDAASGPVRPATAP